MWITLLIASIGYILAKALGAFFMTLVVDPFQPPNPKDQHFLSEFRYRYQAWWIRARTPLGLLSENEQVKRYWSDLAPHLATQFDRTPGLVHWRYDQAWILESDTISRHQLLRFQACLQAFPAPPDVFKSGTFFLSRREENLIHLGLAPYHLLGVHGEHHLTWMLQQTTP